MEAPAPLLEPLLVGCLEAAVAAAVEAAAPWLGPLLVGCLEAALAAAAPLAPVPPAAFF